LKLNNRIREHATCNYSFIAYQAKGSWIVKH